jgi:hypothetical protein
LNKALPWIVFLTFPILGITIYPFIFALTGFGFDGPDIPPAADFFAFFFFWTLCIFVVVWIVCLVLYFFPGRGRRRLYCWIPIGCVALHLFFLVGVWVVLLTAKR